MTGPRIGWLAGGVGSLCWLPLMAMIWLWQGSILYSLLGLVVFAVGICYLWAFAPWRYPRTPIWRIYAGFLAILAMAVAVGILGWREAIDLGQGGGIFPFFFVFLLPFFSFGRRTWSDFEPPP